MNLSTSETNRFINAGIAAACNETHTCAGTDPIVINAIGGINPDSPALPAIVEAWDKGYMAKRGEILISETTCNDFYQ